MTIEEFSENRWRKAEVFGLWAAAAIGVADIIVASHEGDFSLAHSP
jgi:hypothetical protein